MEKYLSLVAFIGLLGGCLSKDKFPLTAKMLFTISLAFILYFILGLSGSGLIEFVLLFVLGIILKDKLPALSHLIFVLLAIGLFGSIINKSI